MAGHNRHGHSAHGIVAFALCVILVGGVTCALDARHARQTREVLSSQATQTVRACEGDTIWAIASRHNVRGVSTYDLVVWLYEENGLHTSLLTPGQPLLVPVPAD